MKHKAKPVDSAALACFKTFLAVSSIGYNPVHLQTHPKALTKLATFGDTFGIY